MRQTLQFCATHGRWVLVVGLMAGVAFPDLALTLRPFLPELVALLLFIAVLRIGPKEVVGTPKDWPITLLLVGIFQVVVPLILILSFRLLGFDGPIAFAICIMAAASVISGSANLTLLTGNDAQSSLRVLILGTAFLPVTVLPVFWLLPQLGSSVEIFAASIRLLLVIVLAGFSGIMIRLFVFREITASSIKAIDGASAVVMAFMVIGLMSAVGPALFNEGMVLTKTMLAAFAANFGLQFSFWLILGVWGQRKHRAGRAICAGNRNMALFLTALPVSLTDPILLFIGCYQFPMFLTPLLLGRLYRR